MVPSVPPQRNASRWSFSSLRFWNRLHCRFNKVTTKLAEIREEAEATLQTIWRERERERAVLGQTAGAEPQVCNGCSLGAGVSISRGKKN